MRHLSIVAMTASMLGCQSADNDDESGATLSYKLGQDAVVTIVVEHEDGAQVRNLVSCAERKAGRNTEQWDGLDVPYSLFLRQYIKV